MATNFCSMCSSFLASVDIIEFYAVEVYSGSGLTGVKYNINKLAGVERNRL